MKVFKRLLRIIALISLVAVVAGFGKWAAIVTVVAAGISVGLTISEIVERKKK